MRVGSASGEDVRKTVMPVGYVESSWMATGCDRAVTRLRGGKAQGTTRDLRLVPVESRSS